MPNTTTRLQEGHPWPPEHQHLTTQPGFGWHHTNNLLLLVTDTYTPELDHALNTQLTLGIITSGPLIGIVLTAPTIPELMSFSTHLPDTPPPDWTRQPPSERDRLAFPFVVVTDNIVRRLRVFTASPHVTATLHREIQARWRTPTTPAAFTRAANHWYDTHPEPWITHSTARCHSGE